MREVLDPIQQGEMEQSERQLRLLIAPDPWPGVFLQNLRELFRKSQPGPLPTQFATADFWPDVFVHRGLPWRRFFQSAGVHIFALAMVWVGSRFLALQPHLAPLATFTHADVVYYAPSEYLPPIDTRRERPAPAQKADPEYSAQPIISLPPQATNRSQTIVAAPNIQMAHDVSVPNVVALMEKTSNLRMPIAPAPSVPASERSHLAPTLDRAVVAPPPLLQAASREALQAPQSSVIAPPPSVDSNPNRRLGDINIGPSAVIAPAPQLSVSEQRAVARRNPSDLSSRTAQVIAPPPSVGASGSRSRNQMVALSLHPVVGAPDPAGNRRGSFAATPEGHKGASGAAGGSGKSDAGGSGKKDASGLPSGLYVGKSSKPASSEAGDPSAKNSSALTVNPRLLADARPPRASSRTMQPESESKLAEEERAVFGNRKFYSLSLNMPNLNSAGGSWIIRFAALKPDANLAAQSRDASNNPAADLSAPSATRKVDPAYPLELMRQNVSGTVILYGVIHADGTVGGLRVLRSVDDRLDAYASAAIAKWQFQPATKNGSPVDVEATFWIPFRPSRVGSSF